MTHSTIAAIILAAGKGTRMKSDLHKVLHQIGGLPMINHLLGTVDCLNADQKIIIVGDRSDQLKTTLTDVDFAEQTEQLGTGHAVQVAAKALKDTPDDVMVLCGDMPFVSSDTLQAMLATRQAGANVVILGFDAEDPKKYGRLILGDDGLLERIVEYNDATEDEREITLCNSGMALIEGKHLSSLLDGLTNDNAAGEYYLTDIVAIANDKGLTVSAVGCEEAEAMGINSRSDLADANFIFQSRMRDQAMENGVTLRDPESVFFAHDTMIEQDVTIEPNVVFGPGVSIASGTTIKAFSHIEGATIGRNAVIGPYARLRPGTELAENTKIGNFVEVKKSIIEAGAKISHLSYIGDASVGEDANIGAGTITCNYDGFNKSKTEIGAGAFIGSNSALVAPVKIGDGAIIGAGSVITKSVEADTLAVTRAGQKSLEGWAKRFRNKMLKKKAK